MLSQALVEGEVDPGGYVSGFIYFEPVDIIDETDVTFVLDLVSADDGTALGTVEVPFIVHK